MQMIPALLDTSQILADLNAWGWRDQKIEVACGFSSGYIAQVRCRNVKSMSYARGARLYNFWVEERLTRFARETLPIQTLAASTS